MEDLYQGTYGTESNPAGYAPAVLGEVLSKLDRLDEEVRGMRKSKKHGKKKNGKKKLKRRLMAMEMEHEKLKYFLQVLAAQQSSMSHNPAWWQNALAKSLPKIFDMGTVVLNNVTRKHPQVVTGKNRSMLYLTDGSDKN